MSKQHEQATMPGRNGGTLRQGGSPGRPKGSGSVTHALRRLLDQTDADGRTKAELLAEALLTRAMEGNGTAIKEIFNRLEGPPQVEEPPQLNLAALSLEELKTLERLALKAQGRDPSELTADQIQQEAERTLGRFTGKPEPLQVRVVYV
jgi:hypothetical protein